MMYVVRSLDYFRPEEGFMLHRVCPLKQNGAPFMHQADNLIPDQSMDDNQENGLFSIQAS